MKVDILNREYKFFVKNNIYNNERIIWNSDMNIKIR